MSLNQTGDTTEPHVISGKRVLANVTLFTMLGLGLMYHQTAELLTVKPSETTQPASLDRQIQTQTITEESATEETEESVAREPDEKAEIAKAISACRSSLGEDDVAALADVIRAQSRKHNYDWKLILAIIRVESQFDARARSHKGARGLMQVLPSTAKWLSPKLGLEYAGRDSLYDPEYNVKLGTSYLYMLHQRFGDIEKAIVAYNRGPDGLTRYLRQGRKFPPTYLVRVMDYYKELKDSANEYTG